VGPRWGFFSQFCDVAEDDLARYGYILDVKVGKKKKKKPYIYSWLPTGTYHKNLASWNFFSFEI
jgi:hypothetical protein